MKYEVYWTKHLDETGVLLPDAPCLHVQDGVTVSWVHAEPHWVCVRLQDQPGFISLWGGAYWVHPASKSAEKDAEPNETIIWPVVEPVQQEAS